MSHVNISDHASATVALEDSFPATTYICGVCQQCLLDSSRINFRVHHASVWDFLDAVRSSCQVCLKLWAAMESRQRTMLEEAATSRPESPQLEDSVFSGAFISYGRVLGIYIMIHDEWLKSHALSAYRAHYGIHLGMSIDLKLIPCSCG